MAISCCKNTFLCKGGSISNGSSFGVGNMVVKNGLIAAEGQCRKKPMSEGKQCRKKLEKTSAMTRQLETQVVGPRKQENVFNIGNFKIFRIFLKVL